MVPLLTAEDSSPEITTSNDRFQVVAIGKVTLLVVPLLVPPAPVESFIINKSQNEGRTMSESLDRITRDPAVMNGQPCIRGMRITVRRALEAMAMYPDRQELFREYPELDDEDLRQALAFAAASLDDKLVELAPR
jgi:uncharacterized protein (DUF433 family)